MPVIADGVYFIKNAQSDLYMDLSGGSAFPNTPIVGWEGTKGDNQKWEIRTVNGVNEFVIKNSVGDAFVALSFLRIFPPRIAAMPEPMAWSIEPVGDDSYRIHFPYAEGVLTLPEDRKGTQLISLSWHGEETQKWVFEAV